MCLMSTGILSGQAMILALFFPVLLTVEIFSLIYPAESH